VPGRDERPNKKPEKRSKHLSTSERNEETRCIDCIDEQTACIDYIEAKIDDAKNYVSVHLRKGLNKQQPEQTCGYPAWWIAVTQAPCPRRIPMHGDK
jgi:hypothetical protein